ncbi:MAG TPA: chemotaxis protein CheX [Polyangiaceae bacterium]|nr:chemotaxis protein CheX [Polyangiaceae bacterium]
MAPFRQSPGDSPSSPRSSALGAFRPLLNALVQSTTVELFQSRGIAVAPIAAQGNPHPIAYFSLAGLVTLSGPRANGSLTLSCADRVFSLFSPPLLATSIGARDLLRELTNQLSGRIKNRLLNYTVVFAIGVPTVLSGQALERQRPRRETEVAYQFRTLRGEMIVTLDLYIDPGTLTYSSSHKVAKEGDFIPF